MTSLPELQAQLRSLQNKRIQMSTTMESLIKQDADLRSKLGQLGVTDVDASISSLSKEAESLKSSITTILQGLNGATAI